MRQTVLALLLLGALGWDIPALADCTTEQGCDDLIKEATDDLYDATQDNPIVDQVEETVPDDTGNTIDDDFVEGGGTLEE